MKHLQKYTWAVLLLLVIPLIYSSCKKEEEAEVIASFTFKVDASNYKMVAFTNTSQNYSTVSWNFGDGGTSTEVSPSHTFATEGEFTVSMTATSSGGKTDTYATKVTIADPNVLLTRLVGETSKTWKLLRDASTGVYPMEVGPIDRSSIWWAVGFNNDELANRPCQLNDEWTFSRDGSMVFDAKGDFWREGSGIFDPSGTCGVTSDMVGASGEDLSAWGSGNHTFRITPGTTNKITAIGKGAFIGFYKSATDIEVMKLTPMMQDSVTYKIVTLTDGPVDTLIVECEYKFELADPAPGGYWRYVLVHYDDPSQEPPLPGNKPAIGFTLDITGLTITANNTTTGADSYLWDFGDGQTSTAQNPTHTYAGGGPYTVKLTATNTNGESTASKGLFVTVDVLTDAALQGAAWKVKVDNMTVFVGGAMGDGGWWSVPKAFLDGSTTGGDDWSCMANDEFIFSAGGVYEYKTNGSARNDGWWGDPHGCIDDAAIAASSGNGPAFGSGIHSYTFTPASGGNRAIIELTNGATGAAFIGFMKGFYGGENTSSANLPNGGNTTNKYEVMGYAKNGAKEYLFVTVDISADHNGSASWSSILER